ncbi:MAG: A24 family peptidase [Planctomycetota bacterium]|jgi:prepilin peptidase CpaA
MVNDKLAMLKWGVVICASFTAAVIDVKSRRIPNWLTGTLFLAGLLWSSWQKGFLGLGEGFVSALVLAMPFIILFIFAGGGAGDAKLTGALGSWLVLREAVIALACICIAGGIQGLLVAVYKRKLKVVLTNMVLPVYNVIIGVIYKAGIKNAVGSIKSMQGERLTVPYGVAIFTGVCAAAAIILRG